MTAPDEHRRRPAPELAFRANHGPPARAARSLSEHRSGSRRHRSIAAGPLGRRVSDRRGRRGRSGNTLSTHADSGLPDAHAARPAASRRWRRAHGRLRHRGAVGRVSAHLGGAGAAGRQPADRPHGESCPLGDDLSRPGRPGQPEQPRSPPLGALLDDGPVKAGNGERFAAPAAVSPWGCVWPAIARPRLVAKERAGLAARSR